LYYEQGIDEIIYIDIVASLYGRSNLVDIVRRTANNIFVPLTVGGGVRNLDDVSTLLRAGADKVAINTAVVRRPELIREVAKEFGSQCMVLSVEAKRRPEGGWEIYTDCGRERSGLDVIDWVKRGIELGAGEILLTSIDQEGTRKGFDLELLASISCFAPVPVIISGGYGEQKHLLDALGHGADAVAFADALHYGRVSLSELRMVAAQTGVRLRKLKK
jgi:cyclase